jgi:putative endonuclease
MFFVYILYSEKLGKYYVGQTNNLSDRLNRHNAGQENFTLKGLPWKLVWSIEVESRAAAMQKEKQIKGRGAKRFLADNGVA